MPTVITRNKGKLDTPRKETTPCQMSLMVVFTLLYIDRRRSRMYSSMAMANRQMAVTSQPAQVKPLRIPPRLVPVFLKKVPKVLISSRNVAPTMTIIKSMSTMRSVTTVPKAREKEMPSQRFNTPHRVNSPMRGTTSEAA